MLIVFKILIIKTDRYFVVKNAMVRNNSVIWGLNTPLTHLKLKEGNYNVV